MTSQEIQAEKNVYLQLRLLNTLRHLLTLDVRALAKLQTNMHRGTEGCFTDIIELSPITQKVLSMMAEEYELNDDYKIVARTSNKLDI